MKKINQFIIVLIFVTSILFILNNWKYSEKFTVLSPIEYSLGPEGDLGQKGSIGDKGITGVGKTYNADLLKSHINNNQLSLGKKDIIQNNNYQLKLSKKIKKGAFKLKMDKFNSGSNSKYINVSGKTTNFYLDDDKMFLKGDIEVFGDIRLKKNNETRSIFYDDIPTGTIFPYYTKTNTKTNTPTIPPGWKQYIDANDKFILGANSKDSNSEESNINTTNESEFDEKFRFKNGNIKLKVENIPNHKHEQSSNSNILDTDIESEPNHHHTIGIEKRMVKNPNYNSAQKSLVAATEPTLKDFFYDENKTDVCLKGYDLNLYAYELWKNPSNDWNEDKCFKDHRLKSFKTKTKVASNGHTHKFNGIPSSTPQTTSSKKTATTLDIEPYHMNLIYIIKLDKVTEPTLLTTFSPTTTTNAPSMAPLDQCGYSYSSDKAKNPDTAGITCPEETPKCYGGVSNKNWGVCVHSNFNNEGNGNCGEQYNSDTIAGGNGWKTCPKTAPKCVGHKYGTWGHCTHSNFNEKNECAHDYKDKVWRDSNIGEMPYMCPISKPNCIGYQKDIIWGQCGLYPDQ